MSSMDSTIALMKSIRSALKADTTLASLITDVYDRPPTKAVCPFLTIGDIGSKDWSTSNTDGQEHAVDVHVWTQPTSQTPETLINRQIVARVRSVLHFSTLAIDSPYSITLMQVVSQVGPMEDPDGATLHSVVTVRALVDHA